MDSGSVRCSRVWAGGPRAEKNEGGPDQPALTGGDGRASRIVVVAGAILVFSVGQR